nr:MAG TPA: hypothetical protein [Bacteriophage sp.]
MKLASLCNLADISLKVLSCFFPLSERALNFLSLTAYAICSLVRGFFLVIIS